MTTDIVTVTRHVLSDQLRLGAIATGDLTLLLTAITTTSKFIATNVRRARLINLIGMAGETNVQGEEQKKLDVLSNDIMINSLRASGKTAILVSEENEEAIFIEDRYRGKYCVVFDPLDGSSNIDAGVNIGTIFGIYHINDINSKASVQDVLKPGSQMVAAGYCMYGSSANLVLSTGNGVNGFTLDPGLGEFILTHPGIGVPPRGKIYSFNEGNSVYLHQPVTNYLKSIKFHHRAKRHTRLGISGPWWPMFTEHCCTVVFSVTQTIRRARKANSGYSTRPSPWPTSLSRQEVSPPREPRGFLIFSPLIFTNAPRSSSAARKTFRI